MATTWISTRMGQFSYFDHQFGNPDWTGKRVLDFGGNVGNLLLDPSCRIDPGDYWSIDVSQDAITEGQRRHPNAHFVFYDRYNYEYNPTGTIRLPVPDLGVRFDYIVAWSVVTHNDKAESLEMIDQLMELLTDDGKLAFTFMDPEWTPPAGWPTRQNEGPGVSNLERMLWKRRKDINPDLDVEGMLAQARSTRLTWVNLVSADVITFDPDDDGLSANKLASRTAADGGQELETVHRDTRTYVALTTPAYMRELFPNARIASPVAPERHHCAIIEKRTGTGR